MISFFIGYNKSMKKTSIYDEYNNNINKYYNIKEKKHKKDRWFYTFYKLVRRYTNGIYYPIKSLFSLDINILLKIFVVLLNLTLVGLSIVFTVDVLFNIRLFENTFGYTIEVLFTLVPLIVLYFVFRYLTGLIVKLISSINK